MATFDNGFANSLIDFLFRGQPLAPAATLYVALTTTAPSPAIVGTEVTGGSYARVAVASSLAAWSGTQGAGTITASSGASRTISNNAPVTFPAPTSAWTVPAAPVVGVELWTAPAGGQRVAFGFLTSAKTIASGDAPPSFGPGALTFNLDS